MFRGIDSLIINNIKIGNYLTEVEFGYFDTWGNDTGYTLSNKFSGTFKGTIPKFTLKFRPLEPEEIIYLTNNIFRTVIQYVQFNDADGTTKNIETHKGDLQLNYTYIDMSKAFSYELVGNEAL